MKSSASAASAASATSEDDIPAVHVLVAAQQQDRKEAEDLLAGFDRPGRSPKAASKQRDFVDYYAKKKSSPGTPSGAARASGGPNNAVVPIRAKQVDVSTVIKPRKREGVPAWVVWPAAGLLMLIIGGVVAFLATAEKAPNAAATRASAATTLSGGPVSPKASNDNIPPPDPAQLAPSATGTTTTAMTVIEPAPAAPAASGRGTTKRDGRGATGASTGAAGAAGGTQAGAARAPRGTNATDDTRPPPRDDFIRDL